MRQAYDRTAQKRSANLTVNSDLLRRAKAYGINLSAVLETALAEEVNRKAREHWRDANADAIAAYNEHVDEAGVFSDGLRTF